MGDKSAKLYGGSEFQLEAIKGQIYLVNLTTNFAAIKCYKLCILF